VREALAAAELDPAYLELDLTESAVMQGPEELDPGAAAVERAGRANLGGQFRNWLLQPELFAAFAAG
jgi:hypothetical protein